MPPDVGLGVILYRASVGTESSEPIPAAELDDLVDGLKVATDDEKDIIRPILKRKIMDKSGELDRDTRERYMDALDE